MATLYVRDMPDDLYERLREEARGARRTIGATAIDMLESGLRAPERSLPIGELLRRARTVRARGAGVTSSSVAGEIRADRDR
jgi:plasmid stability protein